MQQLWELLIHVQNWRYDFFMNFKEFKDFVKEMGVAGAGGAGFPSYAKLDKKTETVILNCAECEPLFKMHRQLLTKYTYEIISMLDRIRELVGAKEFIVAVKEEYVETVEAVKAVIGDYKSGKLSLLSEVYPAGDEVVLIYEVTKKRVPPGNIPLSVGVCVFNVETVLNIYRASEFGMPVTKKYVTVAGEVKNPGTFLVPLGTNFGELIKLAGGKITENASILKGGPMTGFLSSEQDVVTKNTNGVLVFDENHPVIMKRKTKNSISLARAKSSCCQCRMCTDLCPRHLLGMPIDPSAFMDAVSNGAVSNTKVIADAMYCVSCGLCELYACSQGLNPRSLIDEFKQKMRNEGVKIKVYDKCEEDVLPAREYRKVPMRRLKERLDLVRYDKPAKISDIEYSPKRVKLLLSQSIGAPSVAIVSKGDMVKCGEVIAKADKGLSLPVHASIDGKVLDITDKFIIIDKV